MAQSKTAEATETVETIASANVWQAIVDGPNSLTANQEAVFEFTPDGFELSVKDTSSVAIIRQTVDPDAFEHYDVTAPFAMGVDTAKFDDLLGTIGNDAVKFGYDFDSFTWSFRAGDVDYSMAGIDVESVVGSPTTPPPVKDDLSYDVDVTMPVPKLKRASDVVDMLGKIAVCRMGGDDDAFVIEGQSDIDSGGVRVHEADAFAWNTDAPASIQETKHSNSYLSDVVGILDEDAVRIVTGEQLPYHLWTTRAGVVDTKIVQAPRIPKNQ